MPGTKATKNQPVKNASRHNSPISDSAKGTQVTIILDFHPNVNRARVITWLQRALALCPFVVVDVSISPELTQEEKNALN